GKSTVAKRVSMELADEGFTVFFSDGDHRPNPEALAAYARHFQQRGVYVFDNAGHDLHLLADFWGALIESDVKPIVVVVARTNDIANRGYQLADVQPRVIAVPHLSDGDIHAILETLTRHNVLVELRKKTLDEQFDTFKRKAR